MIRCQWAPLALKLCILSRSSGFRDSLILGHNPKLNHVADLAVNTLSEAYEVGNIGPEDKYTRYKTMHSVSVGDILVDEDNTPFVVAPFGFEELDHDKELV